ncbi:hypothetical protein DAI22_03g297532 [Oryza sativa Japonica Group]|nr:hypothetical protein DAI22_03g297532 [Oryza sativa Japonica Group]
MEVMVRERERQRDRETERRRWWEAGRGSNSVQPSSSAGSKQKV